MDCVVELYSGFNELSDDYSLQDPSFISSIVENFTIYKVSNHNIVPDVFGRDVLMQYPAKLTDNGVSHLHVGKFKSNAAQYNRTSDNFLIYAKSHVRFAFLIICIISPNGHKAIRNNNVLHKLIKISDEYQELEFSRL